MRRKALSTAARILLAVVGGYLLTSGLIALLAVSLVASSAFPRSEAAVLATTLGFPLYTLILIWAFWVWRLPALLAMTAAGVLMLAIGHLLALPATGVG